MNESILVIKRSTLFYHTDLWQGIKKDSYEAFELLVNKEKEFHARDSMEKDVGYKQIIPYLIYTYNGQYFLMQRTTKASEQRLKNKYSLGIGGHIRQEDIQSGSIIEWAKREFHEEVNFDGSFSVKTLGIINDDSDAVGKVHLGCVFLLNGDSATISIKSELKSGTLLTLKEIEPYYNNLERWSQLVFDALKEEKEHL